MRDISKISPDGIAFDIWYTQRPEVDEIQLDLMLDYASNVALYPRFQTYFRVHHSGLLVIWGDKDPFFRTPGVEACRRDLHNAQVRFPDRGTSRWRRAEDIATAITDFLKIGT